MPQPPRGRASVFSSTWLSRSPGEVGPQARQLAVRFPVVAVRNLVASQCELRHEGLLMERPLSRCWVLDRKRASRSQQSTRGAQSRAADSRGGLDVADATRLGLGPLGARGAHMNVVERLYIRVVPEENVTANVGIAIAIQRHRLPAALTKRCGEAARAAEQL